MEPDDPAGNYVGPPIGEAAGDGFEARIYQDVRTGQWVACCPLCDWFAEGYTAYGATRGLCDHMNAEHPEPHYGHA